MVFSCSSLVEFISNYGEESCAAITRSKTSLTKEEIQDFWRKRQLDMEEHLKAAKAQTSDSQSETVNCSLNSFFLENCLSP